MAREEDERRRSRTNMIALIAVAVLVLLGVLLMRWLSYESKLADCVAAGHRDCQPLDASPDGQ